MFWLGVGVLLLCVALFPIARLFCKRLSFLLRLRRVCCAKSFHFTPLHPLWLLRLRGGDTFDFAVETRDDAYAVKLFGVWRKHDEMRFGPGDAYRVRHQIAFLSCMGEGVSMTLWESREKPLPAYRYPLKMTASYAGKLWKPVLLMHPVGHSIRLVDSRGSSVQICSGDRASRYPITSAFQFLETLQCAPEWEHL